MNECWLKLTSLALFMNSAAAKRMNAIASAVRRSEKARFLRITDGLIEEKFSISLKRTTAMTRKITQRKKGQQHVYVHEHHSKHEPNYEV